MHEQFQDSEQIETAKKKIVEKFPNLLLKEQRMSLKKYIMLIDTNPDDLLTLKSLLIQYQDSYDLSMDQGEEFCFGTQIMRLFYLLNLPDDAVKVTEHPEITDPFGLPKRT